MSRFLMWLREKEKTGVKYKFWNCADCADYERHEDDVSVHDDDLEWNKNSDEHAESEEEKAEGIANKNGKEWN